jgi:eukaryotic-like serine/threonine-protein kinase
MLQLYSCTQGHFWESADTAAPQTCPQCGAPVEMMPLLDLLPSEPSPSSKPTVPTAPASLLDEKGWPVIAGYQIQAELRKGPFGIRYFVAKQPLLNRRVLLAVVLAKEDNGQRAWGALRGESSALARLSHPNILPIHEAGERDRQVFYNALEYVGGDSLSLAEKVGETPPSPREAARLVELLARTVEYAHGEEQIHRNLRPAVVLLQATAQEGKRAEPIVGGCLLFGEPFLPRLIGFGVANRRPVAGDVTDLELYGDNGGFLSPEQAWGRVKDLGRQTDVYGLGGLLYFLLTGVPPFKGPSPGDLVDAVQSAELVPPSRRRRVPVDLEAVCLKALARVPRRRYQSAREMADDLERFLDGRPVQAKQVGAIGHLMRWAKRDRTTAFLLAVIAGLIITLCLLHGSPDKEGRFAQKSAQDLIQLNEVQRQAVQAQQELRELREAEKFLDYRQQILLAAACRLPDEQERMKKILNACPRDLRKWEWHYLSARARGETVEATLGELSGPVSAFAASPTEASAFAAAAPDEAGRSIVTVWKLPQREPVARITRFLFPVTAMAFAPDGQSLYTLGSQNMLRDSSEVRAWSVRDPRAPRFVQHFGDPLSGLACAREGSSLYLTKNATDLCRLPTHDGALLTTLPSLRAPGFPPTHQTQIAVSCDGQRVAWFNASESTILIWEADNLRGASLHVPFPAQCLAWGENNRLAVGLADSTVRIFDVPTRHEVALIHGHTGPIQYLAFSPDGKRLVSAAEDHTVRIWGQGPTTWRELLSLPFDGGAGLGFERNEKLLVVAGSNGRKYQLRMLGVGAGD